MPVGAQMQLLLLCLFLHFPSFLDEGTQELELVYNQT